MYKFKYWLRNFFGFSQKETNGFIVLTILMILLLFIPMLFTQVLGEQPDTKDKDHMRLDSLVALWQAEETDAISSPSFSEKYSTKKITSFFPFNPNTATVEDFQQLGLQKYLAERIIKYRTKGGTFRVKADLKKMYGFPQGLYDKLEPYIDLPVLLMPEKQKANNKFQPKPGMKPFDINVADTTILIRLKGIGSKLAIRIIKYRDKLGGFIKTEQYDEVFGLDSLALQELRQYAQISKDFIPHKIKLNSADQATLFSHPYIGKKFANVIFNYRQSHGNFDSLEKLSDIKIIDQVSKEKMKNYLTLE